jgi:hypothetical protein
MGDVAVVARVKSWGGVGARSKGEESHRDEAEPERQPAMRFCQALHRAIRALGGLLDRLSAHVHVGGTLRPREG